MQDPMAPGSLPDFSPNVTYASPLETPEREAEQQEWDDELTAELERGEAVPAHTRRVDYNGHTFTSQTRCKNGAWSRPRSLLRGRLPRRARGCSGRPAARKPSRRSRSAQSRTTGDEGPSEGGDGDAGPNRLGAPLERFLAGVLVRSAANRGVSLDRYAENVEAACDSDPDLLRSFSAVLAAAQGSSS